MRQAALAWTILDSEVLLLDYRRAEYLKVNKGGTAIWDLLVAGASFADLVNRLRETYRLEPAAASTDVEAFLRYLDELDLLEPAE